MKKQLGFFIDQSMCTGCKACQTACKDKKDVEAGRLFRRIYENTGGEFDKVDDIYEHNVFAYYTSMACNHCDDPKCVESCPTDAMQKREDDGIVVIDQELCIGCKNCAEACPYGAPQFNEETKKMSKCDLCLDLITKGEEPACVEACPWNLIEYGPIEELRKTYGDLAVTKGLPDPSITKPNLVILPHKDAK